MTETNERYCKSDSTSVCSKHKDYQLSDLILDETYDADDADIAVQMACFGEVVYG